LKLEEVDKDLYELALKEEASAAKEVRENLANVSSEDAAAITAAIQEVDSELLKEQSKKDFERRFLGLAICGLILAYSFYGTTGAFQGHQNFVKSAVKVCVDSLAVFIESVARTFFSAPDNTSPGATAKR